MQLRKKQSWAYLWSISLHGNVSRQTTKVRARLLAMREYSMNFRMQAIREVTVMVVVNGRSQAVLISFFSNSYASCWLWVKFSAHPTKKERMMPIEREDLSLAYHRWKRQFCTRLDCHLQSYSTRCSLDRLLCHPVAYEWDHRRIPVRVDWYCVWWSCTRFD